MSRALLSALACGSTSVALVGVLALPAHANALNGCTASSVFGVSSCQFYASGPVAYHAVGGGRWHIELFRGTSTSPFYWRYSGGTTAGFIDEVQYGDRVVLSVTAGRDGTPQRLDARDAY